LPLDKYYNAEPADFRRAWSDAMLSSAKWEGELTACRSGAALTRRLQPRPRRQGGTRPQQAAEDLDEYVAWGKKLTGNDQWATAVLGGKTDTTTRVLLMWIWANGGEAFNADMTEATFAKNPKALEAIKFYLAFAGKTAIAAPAPTTTNYLEQTNLYAQGKIATMRNAYWAVAKVVGDNPAMAGKSFVAVPPRTPPTHRRSQR
jgi:ABC-type glycerol-3-phosphate transport system substrate-binding protein